MNRDSILFHIGIHKTGTTWLQNHLFATNAGFFYSLDKEGKGKSSFARNFVYNKDGSLLNSFNLNTSGVSKAFESYKKHLTKIELKPLVVSSERLSGNPHSGGFDASAIALRIYSAYPDAKILIVIREQKSWLLSNYFQYLKMGGTQQINNYLNEKYDGKKPGFSHQYLEYHYIIKAYQKLFGIDKVKILTFEQFKNDKVEFMNNISRFTNIEFNLPEEQFANYRNKRERIAPAYYLRIFSSWLNPTSLNSGVVKSHAIAKTYTQLVKFLNLFIPKTLNDKLESSLKDQINNWSKGKFNESNRITQKLIGSDLSHLGYEI